MVHFSNIYSWVCRCKHSEILLNVDFYLLRKEKGNQFSIIIPQDLGYYRRMLTENKTNLELRMTNVVPNNILVHRDYNRAWLSTKVAYLLAFRRCILKKRPVWLSWEFSSYKSVSNAVLYWYTRLLSDTKIKRLQQTFNWKASTLFKMMHD